MRLCKTVPMQIGASGTSESNNVPAPLVVNHVTVSISDGLSI